MKTKRGACIALREEHRGFIDVFFNGIKRHTAAVHTPAILMEGIELRGDEGLENRGMQMLWNTRSIIKDRKIAAPLLFPACDEDGTRIRITRITEQLEHYVLKTGDILFSLTSLRLFGA